jgi:hypothetical protein
MELPRLVAKTLSLFSLPALLSGLGTLGALSGPYPAHAASKWYERLSLRGYAQVRYNRLFETNRELKCEQCDKSWGNLGSLSIRRARLIFAGDVHDRVYVYIQPDFASQDANVGQLRDLYFDLALDSDREFRLRFGQSKVPFGFENLQSSSNRLPLDRADALNSAVPNERDLGVFFYWAPLEIRQRFRQLIEQGLKGSGDYGVVGFGFANGQTPNQLEANNQRMIVARLTYPFQLPSGQFVEGSLQGYSNTIETQALKTPKVAFSGDDPKRDRRVAASFIWYPQPFGLQAEYNWGEGPAYNSNLNLIENAALRGGYVQATYATTLHGQPLTPFVRYQTYDGGKKQEQDARFHRVRDWDLGIEWIPLPAFELTLDYVFSHRITSDSTLRNHDQTGSTLRIQAQFNY